MLGLTPLTDEHWEELQALFVSPRHAPRRAEVDYRLIVDGILWVMRTGSSWRSLPARFGAWSKVLYYYRQWKGDGHPSSALCRPRRSLSPPQPDLSVTVVLGCVWTQLLSGKTEDGASQDAKVAPEKRGGRLRVGSRR